MSAKHAYQLRYLNGDNEPCAVVYARTELGARRRYTIIDCAEFGNVEVERKPEYDPYLATGGPTTTDLFMKHGWSFGCVDCFADRVSFEEDPDAVVVSERRHDGTICCGACVAIRRAR